MVRVFLKTFLSQQSMGHAERWHADTEGPPSLRWPARWCAEGPCAEGPWWVSGTAQMLPTPSRPKLSYLGTLHFLRHIS